MNALMKFNICVLDRERAKFFRDRRKRGLPLPRLQSKADLVIVHKAETFLK